jgi:hypothetical protein
MLIEIKDWPSDRKIKHITFDITFEEDGSPVVKTIPMPHVPVPSPVYGPIVPQPFMPSPTTPVDPLAPPWTVTCNTTDVTNAAAVAPAREHKDIPPEMKDMEF